MWLLNWVWKHGLDPDLKNWKEKVFLEEELMEEKGQNSNTWMRREKMISVWPDLKVHEGQRGKPGSRVGGTSPKNMMEKGKRLLCLRILAFCGGNWRTKRKLLSFGKLSNSGFKANHCNAILWPANVLFLSIFSSLKRSQLFPSLSWFKNSTEILNVRHLL